MHNQGNSQKFHGVQLIFCIILSLYLYMSIRVKKNLISCYFFIALMYFGLFFPLKYFINPSISMLIINFFIFNIFRICFLKVYISKI